MSFLPVPHEAWTDYPVLSLGDQSGKYAPIRRIGLLSYDRDKYVLAEVYESYDSDEVVAHLFFKSGYVYKTYGDYDTAEHIGGAVLHNLPHLKLEDIPNGCNE